MGAEEKVQYKNLRNREAVGYEGWNVTGAIYKTYV
jgi:hypothetical protein